LKELLGRDEGDPQVVKAKGKISQSKEIQLLFARKELNGGPFWSRPDGNIYWGNFSTGSALCFLAETGITKEDPMIAGLGEFLNQYQR